MRSKIKIKFIQPICYLKAQVYLCFLSYSKELIILDSSTIVIFYLDTILQDPLNPEIFTQNPLPVYVVSSTIAYPKPTPEMQIPVEVVEEEKIIVSGEDSKVKEKIGKDLYDMKNENDVIELFKQLGLGKDELREFCKVALNNRKDLDENEKYNEVIESPFVAKFMNDEEMLAKMAKD